MYNTELFYYPSHPYTDEWNNWTYRLSNIVETRGVIGHIQYVVLLDAFSLVADHERK